MFAYASTFEPFDVPADPTPVYVVVGIIAAFVVVGLSWPLVERFWGRYGASLTRLANTEVPIPPVVFEVCGAVVRALSRVVSAVRWCFGPAAERRRRLGRYLASLPPHSGLTAYEEYEAEINSLPAGAVRAAMRHNLQAFIPKPSAGAIRKARAMRGRSRVDEGLIRCLLRGEKPRWYVDVA